MSLRPDLLSALPDLVAAGIRALLPELRECSGMVGGFDLDELKRAGIAAPAVRVSLLAVRPRGAEAGPQRRWSASMAAFVVTRDAMGLPRDVAGANIVAALLGAIPDATWNTPGLGEADGVEARVIVGRAARDITTHLSAVTWSQPLVLADRPAADPLPVTLYVGQAPAIGADNLGDYAQINGGTP